ncbi:methionyl-tRNA formyltransferase [Legionella bononiensis]|uniref:Methionyl-tRNA formyltransferase n=1 Tax=Legionella bononiensis TaxID=2793102 RepID=A0ABS1WA36_9GAMM|nr:methionyl-tRNA formyltransferase [Legionella bononiensis]MBL7480551.1 methionyl-tRNA formyltransferase [Legionella bononiensis]MBL7526210.1 methionyl-tRNA formyltransferase [Legionella bononiensis]MBL7563295.1 methionyl-tRNA formyltransferase [Legionella bononiensis]
MSGLSIVFAGTPEFGLPCLDALYQSSHQVKAVYTQPDRPAGRGRKLQASAVKEWALAHEIPVYQPLNFKNPETISELAALKPDVMIVIAYGLILPKAVLEIPRLGCINVHASLLPRWRGASPIQHAILYGDAQSGVTIMQMDVGMDTGDMLSTVECPITSFDTAGSLHDKLAQLSAQPLLSTLTALAEHKAHPEAQNNELATYAGKINKEDARINWHDSADQIDCRIRAFYPWPIAYTLVGDEILRIHKAHLSETVSSQPPGTILQIDKKGMLVATGNKAILIEVIQFPGGKAISIADWLNSGKTQLHVGLVL